MWGSNLPDAVVADERAVPRRTCSSSSRRLRALGARPFLLLSTRPFTDGEAGDWWRRGGALHGLRPRDLLPGSADPPPGADPRLAQPAQRVSARDHRPDRDRDPALEDRDLPRLPYEPGHGGREGLKPASAWFNHIKLQVLAVKQVAREMPFATDLVVGLGRVVCVATATRTSRPPPASTSGRATRASATGPAGPGPGSTQSLTVGQLRSRRASSARPRGGTSRHGP